MRIRYSFGLTAAAIASLWLSGPAMCGTPQEEFTQIHQRYVQQVAPLAQAAKIAWWNAETIGSDETYAQRVKADDALTSFYSDPETFAKLKELRLSGSIKDPMLKRELDVMYFETPLPGRP